MKSMSVYVLMKGEDPLGPKGPLKPFFHFPTFLPQSYGRGRSDNLQSVTLWLRRGKGPPPLCLKEGTRGQRTVLHSLMMPYHSPKKKGTVRLWRGRNPSSVRTRVLLRRIR